MHIVLCALVGVLLLASTDVRGQGLYPSREGETVRAEASIEMRGGVTVSGIAVMKRQGEVVVGSLFNEFGITALGFRYLEDRDKLELTTVMSMLERRAVRRVVRRDVERWLRLLRRGEAVYVDSRRGITYTLKPLPIQETSAQGGDAGEGMEESKLGLRGKQVWTERKASLG